MSESWQAQLSNCIQSLSCLYQYLDVNTTICEEQIKAEKFFPIKITRAYADRIDPKNPQDPLLLQVLAQTNEMKPNPGFSQDPLEEANSNAIAGLLHKYKSRVLLMTGGQCAIHCRYCFRRHFRYEDNTPGRAGFHKICDYITADKNINEAILSGGDPLVNSDKQLNFMIRELEKIPHLKTIRIHTRLPVVLPDRMTDELIAILTGTRLKVVMVIHANHAQEIDLNVKAVLNKLKMQMILLNQFVLLKGINDNIQDLCNLQTTLFDCGVLPYYCHLPDKVEGTAHFDVSKEKALELIALCQAELPGYLVPRLAKEEAGKPSKTVIA